MSSKDGSTEDLFRLHPELFVVAEGLQDRAV